MPELNTLLDEIGKQADDRSEASAPSADSIAIFDPTAIAQSARQAIMRGIGGKCPRCGQARLFNSFLKPVSECPACAQDWTFQRADDFPAYLSILLTGHLMAPLLILIARTESMPLWAQIGSAVGLAACLMLATLQPAKGAIIAIQWWFGMHGFGRERSSEDH